MKVRILRKRRHEVWLMPHRCADCGKLSLLGRHANSIRCKACHTKHVRQKKAGRYKENGIAKVYKHGYQKARAKAISEHPFCSLCGSRNHLTAHHVGGYHENYCGGGLTILCDKCHQWYEREVNLTKGY